MTHYEYEGKELFKKVGINVPFGIVFDEAAEMEDFLDEHIPVCVKAQVLSGKRGKAGAIKICGTKEDAIKAAKGLFNREINGEKVTKILVEKKLDIKNEYYLSITYDTMHRAPVIMASLKGGVDIEDNKEHIHKQIIDINAGLKKDSAIKLLKAAGYKTEVIDKVSQAMLKLYECFIKFDCKLAEINPLVETTNGEIVAADSKIILDEDALFRQKEIEFTEKRVGGRKPTEIEAKAREIDEGDYRGTAGSAFIEFDGDIAILASGGGASLTCMDALLEYGGKPANYTEYSGNPPDYKVKKLTKLTLSKPGLNGLWVCGGTANFTDIYETLKGFLEGLREVEPKPDYPIVIRRAGPRDKEAFDMLKKAASEEGWDFYLYGAETPMTKTAEIIVDKVNKHKQNKQMKKAKR